ncbi:GroES-like protein [Astrocystis sublimbata]|nr:GroES-like protein [Astrocystis sublimbata]
MSPSNTAAFYPSDKAPQLNISSSPYSTPSPNEVIIHVSAAAINPLDQKIQELGTTLFPFLTYPFAGGLDVAGIVVEVGSGNIESEAKFEVGDRVLGFAGSFASRAGGFQEYVAVPAEGVSKIPNDLSFADAAVLPSGVATAAVMLYQYLGLELPSASASASKPGNGKALLISAGASSVGSNAIQLAVASGYEVLTTSSGRHFQHCASLGAAQVFDYRSPNLVSELNSALKGKVLAGALSCQEGSNAPIFEAVATHNHGHEGVSSNKVACTILFPHTTVPEGVAAEMIHAYSMNGTPLAQSIFGEFLPKALGSNSEGEKGYKCEPKPLVVGKGLEKVQEALDLSKKGISCQKLVVEL